MPTYNEQYQQYVDMTELRLSALCDAYLPLPSQIAEAARYSLLGGGKRVRAVLALAACELAGEQPQKALDFAAALEMLHCYSLIHDDLPCMDNDDTRRGRPSCHKKFPEYTALLAADALVTASFEVIANAKVSEGGRIQAVAALAKAGGARGMLYGQELDKQMEKKAQATEQELLNLHRHKTGALIECAAQLGCIAASALPEFSKQMSLYAAELGLTFQIVDDLLDVTADEQTLGKPIGSDAASGKTTFVTLFGLDGARTLAEQHTQKACQALEQAHTIGSTAFLLELTKRLLNRKK